MTWMSFLTFPSRRALANPFQSLRFSLNHDLLCSSFPQTVILLHLHNINASDVLRSTGGLTRTQAALMVSLEKILHQHEIPRGGGAGWGRHQIRQTDNSGTLCLNSRIFWKDIAGSLRYALLSCRKGWLRMLIIFQNRRCKDQTNIKTKQSFLHQPVNVDTTKENHSKKKNLLP